MPQYKISKQTPLTTEIIRKLINKHRLNEVPRFNTLDNYYHAKNPICKELSQMKLFHVIILLILMPVILQIL